MLMLRLGRCSGMVRAQAVYRRWIGGMAVPVVEAAIIVPDHLNYRFFYRMPLEDAVSDTSDSNRRRTAPAPAPAPVDSEIAAPPLLPLPMPDAEVAILQDRLNYCFKDRKLLEDALIDKSYPNRSLSSLTDPPSPRSYKPLKLTGERTLFRRIRSESSAEVLQLNVSPHKLVRTAIHLRLYDSLRRHSPKLDRTVQTFLDEQEGKLPYGGVPLKVPQLLTDLVYSMMGAILADCNYDNDLAWQNMKPHLQPMYSPEHLDHSISIGTLYDLLESKGMRLGFTTTKMEGTVYSTTALINRIPHGFGISTTWPGSRCVAALDALNKLPHHMFTGGFIPFESRTKTMSLQHLWNLPW